MLRPLLLSLSLVFFFAFQFVVSEIQLGSKLVVGENTLWVSNNGDFALGFFNPPGLPNRFSIGIRFNSDYIPSDQRKVVWVAGAVVYVTDNTSYFELTSNGELVLFDSSLGVPVWNSKTNRFSVSSALLRDDGNLVLLKDREEIVWQSFDTPADTLLPNQKLPSFEMLRAASENSRSSYYSLHLEDSGRLQLRWESNITFWSSGNEALKKKKKIGAVLTSEGALFLEDQDLMRPVWSVFAEDHNDTVKFRFLRLDRDGNLRMYSWNEDSRIWKPVWQAVENQCRVFATCGSQVCSFNSSGSSGCTCPFNAFVSLSDPKCLVPYQKPTCKSGYPMVKFKNFELYGIYPANDSVVFGISSQRCKKVCSDDFACTAVTYTNDGNPQCRMKLTRYISGYSDPSVSSISYVKTCLDPIAVNPNVSKESPPVTVPKSHSICLPCLIGATSTTLVLFLGFQLGVVVYIYQRKKQLAKKKADRFSKAANPKGVMIFSVDEIKAMTGNFDHNIGPGIFKGVMPENELVAVQEMKATLIEERKFRSSASKIGTMHHKNLAKLEGYCCELGRRFLVYEYAKNGSILDHIVDPLRSKKLTWRIRTETCLSVAKALCYLHTECREFVSHGNLNCGNILLGEDLEAKLTEYGFGLCAANKDVEDFGKTVLALVTGRYEPEGVVSEWVYREWIEGRKETVVDKILEGDFDVEELERVLRISFWCVQADERLRPSMGEVVKVLEGTLSVDPPPPPFACARSSPTNSSESSQSLYEP
ncbi:PREDICTED: G-type lectin S-receptor-like serine/threonine-protein kinase SD3-1 [Camelina sativa]|uniref:Receptor-like serine/threonine-protein kinase n=1 Tax=Camelina sativa TaxID=90675 RepID=A0ABM0YUB7_CAMSA|nr:PREDICTED: G-type lectin S-receptor-like serine/threonine-protein kinase SD3-1 [Camelina sativa]XP_010505988.1 PREDICTED: G-type lectin S-receptor-like serine/threonine-protein kinase SD3-1 [Camelina sativa]XP_010505989.1 PREDICTED: G-type lectin S-receptor-like serine/threonine-protein kinase SD3-1 [Camelina sativa]